MDARDARKDVQADMPASIGMLIGREHEINVLDRLIESVDDSGAAVVILGEAGMGKSSLLTFVQTRARQQGVTTLAVRGVEAEAVLPFAAIADLLLPVREYFVRLPTTQRSALEVCLALSDGPARGPLAACAGALGVLAAAAETNSLVIVVDDFQWIDPESARVLSFVSRRVTTERIVMVLAVRDEPDAALSSFSLPVLRLSGLDYDQCAELARRRKVDATPAAIRSLVEWTGGNPLAIVEHLRAGPLSDADVGDPLSGDRIPLHASLDRTWGRLLDRLPESTRLALFVVAADAAAGGRHTENAVYRLGLPMRSLTLAERLGLIRLEGDEIRLRHPLLRSVVFARTPLASRVSAYQALAAAANGYLRIWYTAAAATGPHEAAASTLVCAAGEARDRSGFGAAAQTLRRAAELTGDRYIRAERLLEAAHDAHLAGDSRATVAWCQEALTLRSDPTFIARVQHVAGRAHTWLGDPSRGFDDMVRAAALVRPIDAPAAAGILSEATLPLAMQGHIHDMRRVALQVEDIWAESQEAATAATPTTLAMVAEAFVMSGELSRAEPYLRRAAALLQSSSIVAELQGVAFMAQCLSWSERHVEAREHVDSVVDAARRVASPSILSFALGISAEIRWWTGQWATAYADATEALQWAEEHSQAPLLVGYSLNLLARFEAGRGDQRACEAHVNRARREVEPRGVGCIPIYAGGAIGLAALGAGDLLTAIEVLEHTWELACREGIGNPNVVPIAGDLAEALARTGRSDRCEDVVRWLDERAERTGLTYPRAAACRARGIVASDIDEALRWLSESTAARGALGAVPFEKARTLVCQGEALRRARRSAAARPPLQRALTIFNGLGARAWAARAEAELDASGAKHRRQRPNVKTSTRLDELTPQELQVARAAGRGLNNNEVAAALFISRKTVEAHLTRVYRKLGVRSRTELTRVLLANGVVN